jgi:hypothetical protein
MRAKDGTAHCLLLMAVKQARKQVKQESNCSSIGVCVWVAPACSLLPGTKPGSRAH